MANSSNGSPSGAENFILPTIAFGVVLGALFFVIGYGSMADMQRGAFEAWTPSASVRGLPVMMTLGIFHMTVVCRRLGVVTSVCYALFVAGMFAFVGPERAPVIGYFTLIPLAMLKASGDWEAISKSDKFLYFGALCVFWCVVIVGAVAGFFSVFPSWEGAEFLHASLGMALMPGEHTSLLLTIIIGVLTTVALVAIGGVASSNDFTRIAVFVAPFLFGALCCVVFCPVLLSGTPTEVPLAVMFGLGRVFLVALAGVVLLGGTKQHKTVIVLWQNKLALLGLIAMIALEVANGSGLLSDLT